MKRREVAVLKKIKTKVEEEMEKEDKEGISKSTKTCSHLQKSSKEGGEKRAQGF